MSLGYLIWWLTTAVGAVSIMGILVVLWAAVVTCWLDWRYTPHQRSFQEGIDQERARLRSDARWFSESEETMQLINGLASGENISDVRESWRRSRAATRSPR